ncbi:helix-turn-helix domain-containing protein [Oscillibacter sp. GMB15532]|uniref:helix-turn-helix domain-containing protein n=1 Tax=Oscillibacter sp. GMB15532 TaxID=3230022 RepID=UPI0034DF5FC6
MSTGSNIRKLRIKKGLTQKQLGDLCGMADSAIRRYESDRGNPTEKTLQRIASALGTSAAMLTPPLNYWVDEDGVEHTEFMYEIEPVELTKEELRSRLDKNYAKLNLDGQRKAVERVEELTEIPKYQKEKDPAQSE